jgi:hypothetical protein
MWSDGQARSKARPPQRFFVKDEVEAAYKKNAAKEAMFARDPMFSKDYVKFEGSVFCLDDGLLIKRLRPNMVVRRLVCCGRAVCRGNCSAVASCAGDNGAATDARRVAGVCGSVRFLSLLAAVDMCSCGVAAVVPQLGWWSRRGRGAANPGRHTGA